MSAGQTWPWCQYGCSAAPAGVAPNCQPAGRLVFPARPAAALTAAWILASPSARALGVLSTLTLTVFSGSGKAGSIGGMITPVARSVTAGGMHRGGRYAVRQGRSGGEPGAKQALAYGQRAGQVRAQTRAIRNGKGPGGQPLCWPHACAHSSAEQQPGQAVEPLQRPPSKLGTAARWPGGTARPSLRREALARGPTCEALRLWQVDVDVADGPHAHRGVLDDAIVQAALGLGNEDLALGPAGASGCYQPVTPGGGAMPEGGECSTPQPDEGTRASVAWRGAEAAWLGRGAAQMQPQRKGPCSCACISGTLTGPCTTWWTDWAGVLQKGMGWQERCFVNHQLRPHHGQEMLITFLGQLGRQAALEAAPHCSVPAEVLAVQHRWQTHRWAAPQAAHWARRGPGRCPGTDPARASRARVRGRAQGRGRGRRWARGRDRWWARGQRGGHMESWVGSRGMGRE